MVAGSSPAGGVFNFSILLDMGGRFSAFFFLIFGWILYEVEKFCATLAQFGIPSQDAASMFFVIDSDQTKSVELTEWMESLRHAAPCVHLSDLRARILSRYRTLDACYDSIDDDKNGRISAEEWRDCCSRWRIIASDAKTLYEVLLDTRGDEGEKVWKQGGITRPMFISAMSRADSWTVLWNVARTLIRKHPNCGFDKIFKSIKMNKQRSLSYAEFQSVISGLGPVLSDQDARSLLSIVKPTVESLIVALKMHTGALLEKGPSAARRRRVSQMKNRRKSALFLSQTSFDSNDPTSPKNNASPSNFKSNDSADGGSSPASPSSPSRRRTSMFQRQLSMNIEEEEEKRTAVAMSKVLSKWLNIQDVAWMDLHIGIKLVQLLRPRLLTKYRTLPASFKALCSKSSKGDDSDVLWRVDFVSITTKYMGFSNADAVRMFAVLDLVGNGFVSLSEFMLAIQHTSPLACISDVHKKLMAVCREMEDVEEAVLAIGGIHENEVKEMDFSIQ